VLSVTFSLLSTLLALLHVSKSSITLATTVLGNHGSKQRIPAHTLQSLLITLKSMCWCVELRPIDLLTGQHFSSQLLWKRAITYIKTSVRGDKSGRPCSTNNTDENKDSQWPYSGIRQTACEERDENKEHAGSQDIRQRLDKHRSIVCKLMCRSQA